MAQSLIQVRVDKELRDRVSDVYEAVGLDLPTAIRMFFKRSLLVGGLPFDGRITTNDYLINPHRQAADESTRQRALAAFETMREQASATIDHEPTLDEINGLIDEVRKNRRNSTTR